MTFVYLFTFCLNLLFTTFLVVGSLFPESVCAEDNYGQNVELNYDRSAAKVLFPEILLSGEPGNDTPSLSPRALKTWTCFKIARKASKARSKALLERPPSLERTSSRSPERTLSRTESGERQFNSAKPNGDDAACNTSISLQQALLECLMEVTRHSLAGIPSVAELVKKQLARGASKIGEYVWGQPEETATGPDVSTVEASWEYLTGSPFYPESPPYKIASPVNVNDLYRKRAMTPAPQTTTYVVKGPPSPGGLSKKRSASLTSTNASEGTSGLGRFFMWKSFPKPESLSSLPPAPTPVFLPITPTTAVDPETIVPPGMVVGFIEAARLCFGLFQRDINGKLVLAEDFATTAPAEALKLYPLGALVIGVAEAIVQNVKLIYDDEGKARYDINTKGLAVGLGLAIMATTPFAAAVKIGHIASSFVHRQASMNRHDQGK